MRRWRPTTTPSEPATRSQCALLLALLALASARGAGARDPLSPAVGSTPPDFSSRDAVTHEPIHLAAQQGKVVILTFWATWCNPCRQELPVLEAIQKKVGKERLLVYAVPFDEPEGTYPGLVRAARGWQMTLVDDRFGQIARHYGIRSIPHLFLIGRDGKIAAEHLGFGEDTIQQLVDDVNAAFKPPAGMAADPVKPAE